MATDARIYYQEDCNLDLLKGKKIEDTPGHRKISDILYFASAWQE